VLCAGARRTLLRHLTAHRPLRGEPAVPRRPLTQRPQDLHQPAGAQFVDHFQDDGAGHFSRRFDGTTRAVGDIRVDLVGVQHSDGSIVRAVYVNANGVELASTQARELAAALTNAADELERLG
jgi:hypothetical protein